MNDDKRTKRLSHTMSAILRHRAGSLGIRMDPAGWIAIADLQAHLRVSRAAIDAVVADNNKTRYEVAGARIRASQGHSLDGMPVTQDALEATWSEYRDDASVWHGTRTAAIAGIGESGILRSKRTHVHLAHTPDSRVGKRAAVGVLLEVSSTRLRAAGHRLFRSPNGVILARHVPPECIVGMRPLSRRSRNQSAHLHALLGLSP